mmetsp:Transcript_8653/g.25288  ORF Transcript_8653/g.25288 Transcript_8653/m.25288 type:complete len:200 (-) Transcript_8653:1389-1988(-)
MPKGCGHGTNGTPDAFSRAHRMTSTPTASKRSNERVRACHLRERSLDGCAPNHPPNVAPTTTTPTWLLLDSFTSCTFAISSPLKTHISMRLMAPMQSAATQAALRNLLELLPASVRMANTAKEAMGRATWNAGLSPSFVSKMPRTPQVPTRAWAGGAVSTSTRPGGGRGLGGVSGSKDRPPVATTGRGGGEGVGDGGKS